MRTKIIFHPQMWVNNYAVEADPEGVTFWYEDGIIDPNIENDTVESDELIRSPNAPAWVWNWGGPFWIEIERPSSEPSS